MQTSIMFGTSAPLQHQTRPYNDPIQLNVVAHPFQSWSGDYPATILDISFYLQASSMVIAVSKVGPILRFIHATNKFTSSHVSVPA